MMTYKGYTAKVEFDDDAMVFYGEVIGIRDVVTFQGQSVAEIETAFHDSVDDYLEFCREKGEPPDKPYSGKFVVRLPPDVHRKISIEAKKEGVSLNTWLTRRLASLI
jgi:predicted HicB family RNase H-like nuclease